MALIRCPECGQEVSDKAAKCIHCGYPLGQTAAAPDRPEAAGTKSRIDLDDPGYAPSSPGQVTVQDHKAKALWVILGTVAVVVGVVAFVMINTSKEKSSGSVTLDPNRTKEPCTLYGEARVFGSQHDTSICYPDGDGYYHVLFGHHHHK